jgi:Ca-activated chloride channel family protein
VTSDHGLVLQSLETIDAFPGFGGTAIGDALAEAVKLGQQAVQAPPKPPGQTIAYVISTASPSSRPPVSILFLSDGSQTRGTLQPLQGAQKAKDAGIPVYTFALGTPGGVLTRGFGPFARSIPVPPDPTTLKAIADTTGGEFLAAKSASSLKAAYARLGTKLGTSPGHREVTYKFLGLAALLLVAAGVLSALWSPRLP